MSFRPAAQKQAGRALFAEHYWFLYVTDYVGERWRIQHGSH